MVADLSARLESDQSLFFFLCACSCFMTELTVLLGIVCLIGQKEVLIIEVLWIGEGCGNITLVMACVYLSTLFLLANRKWTIKETDGNTFVFFASCLNLF